MILRLNEDTEMLNLKPSLKSRRKPSGACATSVKATTGKITRRMLSEDTKHENEKETGNAGNSRNIKVWQEEKKR